MTSGFPPSPSAGSPYEADFYRRRDRNTRASAVAVVAVMQALGPFRSVVDVGCGVGTWLAAFQEAGAEEVFGVEGEWLDPARLEIPRHCFLAHDLRRPLSLERRFDLAMSLEVAEHLPAECAEGFVATLTRLAPVVLFSAAIPFQGGTGHVHERWPDYWAGLFDAAGYAVADAVRRHVWNDPEVRPWYAQNALVYVDRRHLADHPRLAAEVERTDRRQLALVHPRLYERNSDPHRWSLRTVLRALPRLLTGAVHRRITGRAGRRDGKDATP